jgi:hypothetical protein
MPGRAGGGSLTRRRRSSETRARSCSCSCDSAAASASSMAPPAGEGDTGPQAVRLLPDDPTVCRNSGLLKDAEFPGSTKQPNTQNHVSSVNTHWADPNEKQCQMVSDPLGQLGNPANQSVDPHPTRRIPRPRSSVQQRSHVRHRSAA